MISSPISHKSKESSEAKPTPSMVSRPSPSSPPPKPPKIYKANVPLLASLKSANYKSGPISSWSPNTLSSPTSKAAQQHGRN